VETSVLVARRCTLHLGLASRPLTLKLLAATLEARVELALLVRFSKPSSNGERLVWCMQTRGAQLLVFQLTGSGPSGGHAKSRNGSHSGAGRQPGGRRPLGWRSSC